MTDDFELCMTDLTPKQDLFCRKYIEAGNASEAYRFAFSTRRMTDKSVHEAASRMLKKGKVRARLNELKHSHLKRHEVTVDRVVAEYARLAFADLRAAFDGAGCLLPLSEMPPDLTAALASLEAEEIYTGRGRKRTRSGRLHKIKLADKKGALDSLAKYLGMFRDAAEPPEPVAQAGQEKEAGLIEIARRLAFVLAAASKAQPGKQPSKD